MLRKNFAVGFFALFLMLLYTAPFCLALDTDFNIKTMPNHKIAVVVRETGKLTSLESFFKETGTGELSIKFSSSQTSLDVIMTVRKDGATVVNEKFEGIAAGNPVNVLLYPGNAKIVESFEEEKNESQNITNATIENPVNTTEETINSTQEAAAQNAAAESETPKNESVGTTERNESGKLTGAIINTGKSIIFSKATYYIIGITLFLFVLAFIFLTMRKKIQARKGSDHEFRIIPVSQRREIRQAGGSYDKKIIEVEKKILDARKELDEIKNRKNRLAEARKKFEESKRELERVEKGY